MFKFILVKPGHSQSIITWWIGILSFLPYIKTNRYVTMSLIRIVNFSEQKPNISQHRKCNSLCIGFLLLQLLMCNKLPQI